jgi:hypothetical protein
MDNLEFLELKLHNQYMAQAVAMMNAHLKTFNELLRKHDLNLSNEYSVMLLDNLNASGSFQAAEQHAKDIEEQIAAIRGN